jgi:hypothetical protein
MGLRKVIDETLASGLERPEAWEVVQEKVEGVVDENMFRAEYRAAQLAFNAPKKAAPKAKAKAKAAPSKRK